MPHRYPFHASPKSHAAGNITVIASISLVTYLAYKAYRRGEDRRIQITNDFKPLDPNLLIPSSIVPVNEERLRRAILEGDKYVSEHLDKRGDFIRFALAHSAGVKDLRGYVNYLETLYSNLFNG